VLFMSQTDVQTHAEPPRKTKRSNTSIDHGETSTQRCRIFVYFFLLLLLLRQSVWSFQIYDVRSSQQQKQQRPSPLPKSSLVSTTSTLSLSSSSSGQLLFLATSSNRDKDDDDGTDDKDIRQPTTSSYDDTDVGSKGFVGGLTSIINSLSGCNSNTAGSGNVKEQASLPSSSSSSSRSTPPSSSQELLERLRRDYTRRNYLWTGDLDLNCFADDCRFTDPTISFVGTDKYSENTQNLVPIVNAFVTLKDDEDDDDDDDEPTATAATAATKGQSILLSIEDNPQDKYIETRWNMVGTLDKNPFLFWKPKIDVIGRTKFWYNTIQKELEEDDGDDVGRYYYQVWFYDEEWEIPAYRALLQLITPGGTIANAITSKQK
jgi:hypothetical protein